ncbi:MAG: glycosyltransferase [Helicobacter sp.]|nr:glycosyltransferase [Helicobacter sp.]
MKILHLCTSDSGGAGRAALRLHKALLEQKVESLMLVQNKTSDLPSVIRLAKSKPQKIMEKLRPALSQLPLMFYPKREKDIFSPNGLHNKTLLNTIKAIKPDVLHLHWIGGGFLHIKDLQKLKMPMLWSLHDANPYTGGCHYVAAACIGVGVHCKKCPLLNSQSKFDISFWTFRTKAQTYPKLNLTINGLSRWIASCAKESLLLKDKPIINLPNPIDTNIYKPIPKDIAKELLGLTAKKTIITFGAIGATSIERKGYPQLKMAIKLLQNKLDMQLVIFGASSGDNIEEVETLYLGHLNDDIALRIIYSLSDVVIVPSLVESFGQVALESLSCGTPVVAFDTSGLKDIVTHKIDGYLAKAFDAHDLSEGILYVLAHTKTLSRNARQKAVQNFDSKLVSKQYIAKYQEILNGFVVNEGGGLKQSKSLKRSKQLAFLESLAKDLSVCQESYLSLKDFFNFISQTNPPHYIAFGALSGTDIARKGYSELVLALSQLSEDKPKCKYELLVFGSSDGTQIPDTKIHFLGCKYDDETLSLIYSASRIFIAPSLAENLSNTIMESLSCGTPVVAFDIGGNKDMITHKVNGYLAQDIDDLKRGIAWILELDSLRYQELCDNARKSVLQKFDARDVANSYVDTYKKMIASYKITLRGGGI